MNTLQVIFEMTLTIVQIVIIASNIINSEA